MAPEAAPHRSRGLVLALPSATALISTASAYFAMVKFGTDVLAMDALSSYALSGVFELTLMGVALLAREAAIENRPNERLLTITWALSAASGAFAASHEIHEGHGVFAAAFRFLVPLLAALMWHLVLVGDQHLASGRSLSRIRAGRQMHTLFIAAEAWIKASTEADAAVGTRTGTKLRKRAEKAEKAFRGARAAALRNVPPDQIDREVSEWVAAFIRVNRGIEQIGALSDLVRPSSAAVALAARDALAVHQVTANVTDAPPALAAPKCADGGDTATTPSANDKTAMSGTTSDTGLRGVTATAAATRPRAGVDRQPASNDTTPSPAKPRATGAAANRGGQAARARSSAEEPNGGLSEAEVHELVHSLKAQGAGVKEIAKELKKADVPVKKIAVVLGVSDRTAFRYVSGSGSARRSGAAGASTTADMEQPVTVASVTVPSTRGGVAQINDHQDGAVSPREPDSKIDGTVTATTDTSPADGSGVTRETAEGADDRGSDSDTAVASSDTAEKSEKSGSATSDRELPWHKVTDPAAANESSKYEVIAAAS